MLSLVPRPLFAEHTSITQINKGIMTGSRYPPIMLDQLDSDQKEYYNMLETFMFKAFGENGDLYALQKSFMVCIGLAER